MMKNSRKKCLAIVLMVFLSIGFGVTSVNAAPLENQQEKLRVYLPLYEGWASLDEAGNPQGYTYDYLMKIAQRTGWEYEFVVVEATADCIANGVAELEKGNVDLLTMMPSDGTYDDVLEFPTVFYAQPRVWFMALADNQEISERTLMDMQNLTIALVKSETEDNALMDQVLANFPLKLEKIYADSKKECVELMKSGQADLMINRDSSIDPATKPVAAFSTDRLFIVAAKANPELSKMLAFALMEIETAGDVMYQLDLHYKYFPKYNAPYLDLTETERDYISTAPTLRVGVLDNNPPVSYYNKETNEYSGVLIDMMREIESRSGLKFTYISAETGTALQEMSKAGELDIIAGFPDSYDIAKECGMRLTSSILKSPIVRIYNKSSNAKNEDTLTSIAGVLPLEAKDSIYVGSTQEVLDMVSQGEYNTAYVNGYMAQWFMGKQLYSNLTMTLIPSSNYDLCIAVSNNTDIHLMWVLEQAISQMPKNVTEDIVYENTSILPKLTIWQLIKNNSSYFIFPLIVIFFTITVLLLLFLYKSKKLNRMIAKERLTYKEKSVLDQMTGIYNNASFKMFAGEYLSSENPMGALMICDVDNFKNINDTYGHLFGDTVLEKISEELRNVYPQSSLFGRIGGDEFAVLLCGSITQEQLALYGTKLLERCAVLDETCPITLSMGISMFDCTMPFDKLFYDADVALYNAKKSGKKTFEIKTYQKS